MNFSTIKKLAVTSAVSLTLFAGANAQAQVTSTIAANFATASALATAPIDDIDFGEWAINIGGGDTLTIPLTAVIAGLPPVPTCSGVVDAATLCINTIAPATAGSVSVTTPTATTVQINGVVTNDFPGASFASLGSLVYTDTVVTDTAIPAVTSPATVATTTSNAAETIGIGGTLTITGGTPAASTAFTATDVDITFQY